MEAEIMELLNYGILGLWTLSLLYEKYNVNKKMMAIIKDNTDALKSLKNKLK